MISNKDSHSRDALFSRKQAAEYLGVKPSTLAAWACNKRYELEYIKVGRLVKYRLSCLETFLRHRTCIDSQDNFGGRYV